LAVGGGEWSASRSERFIRAERDTQHSLKTSLGWPQTRSGRLGVLMLRTIITVVAETKISAYSQLRTSTSNPHSIFP